MVNLSQLREQIMYLNDQMPRGFDHFKSEFHRLHTEILATQVSDSITLRELNWIVREKVRNPTAWQFVRHGLRDSLRRPAQHQGEKEEDTFNGKSICIEFYWCYLLNSNQNQITGALIRIARHKWSVDLDDIIDLEHHNHLRQVVQAEAVIYVIPKSICVKR